jgi:hypothetical protein
MIRAAILTPKMVRASILVPKMVRAGHLAQKPFCAVLRNLFLLCEKAR